LTFFLYFCLFGFSEPFKFTTDGEEQDDRLDWLGDEAQKLTIQSATTALRT
jgi:hypothetical protein